MLLNRIKKAFSKKNIFYAILFFSIFFALQDVSFAVDPNGWLKINIPSEAPSKVIEVVKGLLQILGSILWVVTALTSLFLHPGWYNGQIFDLNVYLKDIWILMSNIVYFIFAFILIFIAFMNIVWKGWEKYQLKAALPKFVIWVLIVPFTWFIVQFVLSISAILTVSVLALPYDTFKEYDFFKNWVASKTICTKFKMELSSGSWELLKCKSNWVVEDWIDWNSSSNFARDYKAINKIMDWSQWKWWPSDSIFGIVSIYTYWVLAIDGFDTISQKNISFDGVKKITDLWVKVIFDIIFVLAYCILMIALFMALFTRWVRLWIFTMLSPLFWLMYFFDKSSWWEGFMKKFNFKQFISVAMVPVYVSAALSFWMVFILVASDGMKKQTTTNTWDEIISCPQWKNCSIKIWDFEFELEWAVWKSDNTLWWALWSVWTLIVQMFGLVILWLAVITALKQSEITAEIIAPIEQFGSKIWETAMKMPQYTPILPGWLSAQWLATAASTVSWWIERKATEWWSNWAHNNFSNLLWWEKWKKLSKAALDITTSSDQLQKFNAMRAWIASAWSSKEIADSKPLRDALVEWFKTLKWTTYWNNLDQKEFDTLMTKLWSSTISDNEVKDILSKLDSNPRNANYSILWWVWWDANDPNKVDEVIAWMAKSWNSGSTPTPQTNNIKFDLYRTQWDWTTFDISKVESFVSHLFALRLWRTFTDESLKEKLWEQGFWWDLDKVIQKIKDVAEKEWQHPSWDKLFKEPKSNP